MVRLGLENERREGGGVIHERRKPSCDLELTKELRKRYDVTQRIASQHRGQHQTIRDTV